MSDITIVLPLVEELLDSDHPPLVVAGRLTREQAASFAQSYGDCYAHCELHDDDEGAAYRAVFSSETGHGHLSLVFYHTSLS